MIGLTGRLVGMAASSQLPDIQRDDRDDRVALRGSKRRRAHRRMCAQVRSHFHTTSIALGFPQTSAGGRDAAPELIQGEDSRMRRRDFIAGLGSAAALPAVARA
jgi:hypothetical protein